MPAKQHTKAEKAKDDRHTKESEAAARKDATEVLQHLATMEMEAEERMVTTKANRPKPVHPCPHPHPCIYPQASQVALSNKEQEQGPITNCVSEINDIIDKEYSPFLKSQHDECCDGEDDCQVEISEASAKVQRKPVLMRAAISAYKLDHQKEMAAVAIRKQPGKQLPYIGIFFWNMTLMEMVI